MQIASVNLLEAVSTLAWRVTLSGFLRLFKRFACAKFLFTCLFLLLEEQVEIELGYLELAEVAV